MKNHSLFIILILSFLFPKDNDGYYYFWDIHQYQDSLDKYPLINSKSVSNYIMSFPTPAGDKKEFYMYNSPVMPDELANKFPNIKTFTGTGIHNPSELVSLSIYNDEASAMIYSKEGKIFISKHSDSDLYSVSYNESGYNNEYFDCGHPAFINQNVLARSNQFDECIGEDEPCYTMGNKLITYRIAMIMTESVTNSVADGTVEGGMAWIASIVNQLNLLWRRELGFEFEIISNNNILVFTNNNPAPSEFAVSNCTETADGDPKYCEINNVEPYLESVIGVGGLNAPDEIRLWEYGLVLNTTYNGGVAQAPGPISANNPTYEVLNHELGHNLGSAHNITIENGYRSSLGGTIMGSRTRTVPGSKGDQYTLHTIEIGFKNYNTLPNDPVYGEAYAYLNGSKNSITNNTIPTLSVPESGFFIPKGTPFVLEGTSIPEDSNYLYSWEQNDISTTSFCMDLTSSADECLGLQSWPSNEGPLFSTVDLTPNGNKRYFPVMSSLLTNQYTTTFDDYGTILTVERLPFGSRDINMRLQVRTNEIGGGSVNFKNVKFSVDGNSGPFQVTSQSTSDVWLSQSNQTIKWDIANTNLSPVNCTNVDILLSSDAGRNFDIILADDVPNNGSYDIVVPQMASTDSCRIMIKASDNIFFDINNAYISISNTNVPNISLNTTDINIEANINSQLETELILSNNGEIGSVLSYQLTFIDSIYLNESFDSLDLDNTVTNTEYILPANWESSSEGRGWIIGTEETSAYEDWIISQVGDMYFDIPHWSGGNYAYTDDDQYSVCPSCSPYTGTDCYPNCADGSLDYLLTPKIFIPTNSNAFLSFDSFGLEGSNHSNILQIFSDNVWSDIESLSHSQNLFFLQEYDLSSFSGKEIQIRFHSESNEPGPGEGWAIDNVKIESRPTWLSSLVNNGDIIAGNSVSIPLLINTTGLNESSNYKTKIYINNKSNNISSVVSLSLNIIKSVLGCTDMNACNYNAQANLDDGDCIYPENNYDCDGNQLSLYNDLIPQEYSIDQIYPNPFNPITNISYGIPELSNVQVIIYDLKGSKLVTLINESKTPGYYSISWNADNHPSGMYFVKMISDEYISTQKLILIK